MGSSFSQVSENSIESGASLACRPGTFGLSGPGWSGAGTDEPAPNTVHNSGDKAGGRRLGGNLRQYVHALDLGCDPEILAGALLHAQHTGVAAHPVLLSRGQLGRKDED